MFKKILISFIFLTLVYPVFALEKNKETVLEETKQEIIDCLTEYFNSIRIN